MVNNKNNKVMYDENVKVSLWTVEVDLDVYDNTPMEELYSVGFLSSKGYLEKGVRQLSSEVDGLGYGHLANIGQYMAPIARRTGNALVPYLLVSGTVGYMVPLMPLGYITWEILESLIPIVPFDFDLEEMKKKYESPTMYVHHCMTDILSSKQLR